MLNIYIPKEPQLRDYGISEMEIPEIERFKIRPQKAAFSRKEALEDFSFIIGIVLIYSFFVFVFFEEDRWAAFLIAILWTLLVCFKNIVPNFIALILYSIFNLIVPKFILHDREQTYDEKTLLMIKKKEQLRKYQKEEYAWKRQVDSICHDYPHAIDYFPKGFETGTFQYLEYERIYISFYIKEFFVNRFAKEVDCVDRILIKEREEEEKRHKEDWWKSISDAQFENEVGKWYKDKGYKVKVTQKSSDGGVDIILQKDAETSYVQCKQWKESVPVSVVRELYGVMSLHGIKHGEIVCLKGGTKGAYDFATECGICIVTLKDLVKTDSIKPEISPMNRYYSSLHGIYGEYRFSEIGWRDENEAQTVFRKTKISFDTNYNTSNAYAFYKCHSFYIRVEGPKEKMVKLPDVDFVMELDKGDIIFRKAQPTKVPSKSTYHPQKRKRKGGWYGYKNM